MTETVLAELKEHPLLIRHFTHRINNYIFQDIVIDQQRTVPFSIVLNA